MKSDRAVDGLGSISPDYLIARVIAEWIFFTCAMAWLVTELENHVAWNRALRSLSPTFEIAMTIRP